MKQFSNKTVSEIALEMPITTRIFEEHKIDFCCGGQKIFHEACQTAGANPETVMQEIEDLVRRSETKEFVWIKETSMSNLIEYILDKHHVFTKDEIENLTPLMAKVAIRHGENHLELIELESVFNELCQDLSQHLLKEEQILFPFIQKLENSVSGDLNSCFGTVQNPIRMMIMEHDKAGDLLRKMRVVSKDYALPENACPSYTALFNRLEAFELDLHQHIHLENNLLFPRAIELEENAIVQ